MLGINRVNKTITTDKNVSRIHPTETAIFLPPKRISNFLGRGLYSRHSLPRRQANQPFLEIRSRLTAWKVIHVWKDKDG